MCNCLLHIDTDIIKKQAVQRRLVIELSDDEEDDMVEVKKLSANTARDSSPRFRSSRDTSKLKDASHRGREQEAL
jgi:hypothetical protein